MRVPLFMIFAAFVAARAGRAAVMTADSERGRRLFETQSCIECHSLHGTGGTGAPDLGRSIDRGYTPVLLAAAMWNHAPAMWEAMRRRQTPPPALSGQDAADLFAYFYSVRFFGTPGDAGRGKRLFSERRCGSCHGSEESRAAGARPLREWHSTGDPIFLASEMWNHAHNMKAAFDRSGIAWQTLTSQELADILVYVRSVAGKAVPATRFAIATSDSGEKLFDAKGCAGCHTSRLALPPRLKNQNLTDIAVAMWNHAPKMAQPPPHLAPEEMRAIVTYLWVQQLSAESGNPDRGKRVFEAKQCAACHENPASGAPRLADRKGSFSPISIVSALWRHGPRMLDRMTAQNIAWPRFTGRQMSDLIAYLNADQHEEKQ